MCICSEVFRCFVWEHARLQSQRIPVVGYYWRIFSLREGRGIGGCRLEIHDSLIGDQSAHHPREWGRESNRKRIG